MTPIRTAVARLAPIALALLAPLAARAASLPPAIAAAAANPARAESAKNDAVRKGPEILAFAGVKPGQKIGDLLPGGGYFTRLFSLTVGAKGHVYAVFADEYLSEGDDELKAITQLASTAPFANVSVLRQPAKAFAAPEPLDLVFTSQNYHDYPDPFMGRIDPAVLNKAVFKALKPGGLFVIVDHRAPAGAGMKDTDTLHRIDPATVRQQVAAAGFRFEGESKLLANPKDPLTIPVFDKSIRGHTDQFVMKFRKPR